MKMTSLVARAFRGLKTARVRTLLTALAIAVGGFVLTLTLAASNGTKQYADSIIGDVIADNALVISKMNLNSADEFTKPQKYDGQTSVDGSSIKYLDAVDLEKIQSYGFIESVTESYQITTQSISFEVNGKTEKYRGTLSGDSPSQRAGELAAGSSSELKRGQMIIADSYREALGYKQASDLLGKKVSATIPSPMSLVDENAPTRSEEFEVVGVAKSSGLSGNPLGIYINRADAKDLSEYMTIGTPAYQKYLAVDAVVKDGAKESVMEKAQATLKKDGFESQSAKDAQAIAGQIINVLQGIVFGFGAITLVASVFGVVNTMYISVLERTREIGLMKALGMSSRALKWLFRIEAAWIGLLGGVIGSLLGWGAGSLLNPWISNKLDLDGSLLVFPVGQIAVMIFVLMFVAMLAGILPARKASRLDPVEALRTE
jgi:putative ABC transport system permease protein